MAVLVAGSRSPRGKRSTDMAYASPADGDVLLAVAEHARWVAEFVNGTTATGYGNLQQVAPPTPMMGERAPGHDHTGGIMGHPQKHTIWQHAWGYPDSTDTEFNEAPLTATPGSVWGRIIDSALPPVWCPPGYVYSVGCEVTFIVRFVDAYADLNIRVVANGIAVEHVYSSAVSDGTKNITMTKLVPLRGGFNNVTVKVETGTWSASPGYCHLLHMGIHQIHDAPVPTITP